MQLHWQKQGYLFLASQNISLFGTMVTGYAITWYISLTTNSGLWLALATVSTLLPQILISLISGSWADRYSRKWLIIGADGGIALLTLGLSIIWELGFHSLPWLLIFAALRSVGQGIQQPAVSSAYPQLVPEKELTRINGINQTLMSLSTLLSPMVGGLILANFDLYWALMIDVVTAIVELLCMFQIKLKPVKSDKKQTPSTDFLTGFKYLFGNSILRRLFTINALSFLLMTPATVLSLLLIQRQFGATVSYLTLQEVVWASGSIMSGLIVAKHKAFKNNSRVLGLAIGAFAITMVLMGFMSNIWLYLGAMFLAGWSMPFIMTTQAVIIQTTAAPDFMGRTFANYQMIGNLMLLIGSLTLGPLADVIPLIWIFITCGLLLLISAIWYLKATQY
ncbi:MFS transporter [Pediococcus inopinatus]|uniref:MFS transporter n=1 Tax=Pediococcus inopinatus TaxID=114090 RepID=A0ABZ0Q497_9LACO|nr:MFS transporter [Pediococcus inopinatus]WPC16807.1 MFS transporter [Pediococcus inopinatus]WPC20069.1 MFS transporter [Pediococcus inopinatus]WPC21772.1 MFS transporter [Pediococcus inopinatus]WPP09299.1 MFS transporter [Pediococcus inopinatus]